MKKQGNKTAIQHIADENPKVFERSLDEHFLASRSLSIRKTASLLLSSSFGANSLLYGAFLGYAMGVWALVIQFAWTASFYLMARFSNQVYESTSLHEFLGRKYGQTTRKVAALCSIIGILYFAGWEIAIARSSLGSTVNISQSSTLLLVLLVALVATAYTVTWGRRGNGKINLVVNSAKSIGLLLITVLLAWTTVKNHAVTGSMLLPHVSEAISALGVIGLITNLVLNLGWQFVDNSSWQSVISASQTSSNPKRSLRLAGLATFFTINGLSVLLGTLLRSASGVDANNILGQVVSNTSVLHSVSLAVMVGLLLLSAMTLIDGAMLSVSQTITVDFRNKLISPKRVTLRYARIATIIVSLLIAFGVNIFINALGGSIFNFVYIFVIAQLSLTGTVLAGLIFPNVKAKHMWAPVVAGLAIGFGAAIVGTFIDNQILVQAAGTIATIVSTCYAFIEVRLAC